MGLLAAGGLFILGDYLLKNGYKKQSITHTNILKFIRMYLPDKYNKEHSLSLIINNIIVTAEIAASDSQKTMGLSGRNSLPEDRGMLFVYDAPAAEYFWMKDMRFPIDIIWIDKNFKIVYIADNVQPDSFPSKFSSPKPAQYVLEVNAGFTEKNNIKIGDEIKLR